MDEHDYVMIEAMRPLEGSVSAATRYAGALALEAAALVTRLAFPSLLDRAPYITSYIALVLAARYCGRGPSILTAMCAAVGASLLSHPFDRTRLLLFIISAGVLLWVVDAFRRARAESEKSAILAEERLAEIERAAAHRAEEERVSSQLRAIVESSEDAIISKDLAGIIQTWNGGAEQIFGYTAAEAIGQPIRMLLTPDRLHEESDIMERIRRGGHLSHFETVRVRKDGKQIHVSITVSPMRNEAGGIIGASHIARDITERKAFEEQLRETQKLESLGVLAGGLAHDFNNLLTGIMGNTSLAMDEAGNVEQLHARLDEVLQASDRAALLIRQMLAYAGKGRFHLETVDLSAQVREIVPLLSNSISKLVEMRTNLAGDLPAIEADRSQMQQLIMNLALNAAESIEDRAGTVTVSTSGREDGTGRQVVLEVTDTGCGMTEETRARIFDPFFTTKFTGRGLGLAAVTGIIRAHQGTISVDTALGVGTTFRIVLPAVAGEAAPAKAVIQTELAGQGLVLIADDEELVRTMARVTLERFGYTVVLATNGREAEDRFAERREEYAAVLLDLTMPVLHGEAVLRYIRALRSDVPVVLSSGYTESEALKRFEDLRLAGFLQKPYTATTLARKIKHAIRGVAA